MYTDLHVYTDVYREQSLKMGAGRGSKMRDGKKQKEEDVSPMACPGILKKCGVFPEGKYSTRSTRESRWAGFCCCFCYSCRFLTGDEERMMMMMMMMRENEDPNPRRTGVEEKRTMRNMFFLS